MFGTHLGARNVRAPAAHQLFGVVVIARARVRIALRFAAEVGLAAFVADVVGVPFEREAGRVIVKSRACK